MQAKAAAPEAEPLPGHPRSRVVPNPLRSFDADPTARLVLGMGGWTGRETCTLWKLEKVKMLPAAGASLLARH